MLISHSDFVNASLHCQMSLILEEIAGAIQRQHKTRTNSERELLIQVQAIQTRAKDVLEKLGKSSLSTILIALGFSSYKVISSF